MTETAIVALLTFFATVGPIDVAAVFVGLTPRADAAARRSMAVRGTLIAAVILVLFALGGGWLLRGLGISLAALQVAGGILLLLIAIDMVFARSSGAQSTTDAEAAEAARKSDIAVFPLASPLIAGPGTMAAVILLMADAGGDLWRQAIIVAALLAILLLTLACLLLASQLHRLLGTTGMLVVTRLIGVVLAALAVQFLFDGIAASGLLDA